MIDSPVSRQKYCPSCREIQYKLKEKEYNKYQNNLPRIKKAKKKADAQRSDYFKKYTAEYNSRPEVIRYRKNYELIKSCGITLEQKEQMIEACNNKCAISGKELGLANDCCVDHNHKTKQIRGLLKRNINTALGLFRENINTISNAIVYLQSNHSNGAFEGDGRNKAMRTKRTELASLQKNHCAICGNKFKGTRDMHLDHDHSTGQTRQVLCNHCNTAIGLVEEDIVILTNMISYLKQHDQKEGNYEAVVQDCRNELALQC